MFGSKALMAATRAGAGFGCPDIGHRLTFGDSLAVLFYQPPPPPPPPPPPEEPPPPLPELEPGAVDADETAETRAELMAVENAAPLMNDGPNVEREDSGALIEAKTSLNWRDHC